MCYDRIALPRERIPCNVKASEYYKLLTVRCYLKHRDPTAASLVLKPLIGKQVFTR